MRWLIATSAVLLLLAGCGSSSDAGPAPAAGTTPSETSLTGHTRDIYEQQRSVCKTEAHFNTIEYRQQHGATDPERYAAYAAEHGFYLVRDDAERQAAIDGCLAGLP